MRWLPGNEPDHPAFLGPVNARQVLTPMRWEWTGTAPFLVYLKVVNFDELLALRWYSIAREAVSAEFRTWLLDASVRVLDHTFHGTPCPSGFEFRTAMIDAFTVAP